MRTNYEMVMSLNMKYTPAARGIVSVDEACMISSELALAEREVLDLRNLRDFVVLFMSSTFDELFKEEKTDAALAVLDKESAIVSVIDREIFHKDGEI